MTAAHATPGDLAERDLSYIGSLAKLLRNESDMFAEDPNGLEAVALAIELMAERAGVNVHALSRSTLEVAHG